MNLVINAANMRKAEEADIADIAATMTQKEMYISRK